MTASAPASLSGFPALERLYGVLRVVVAEIYHAADVNGASVDEVRLHDAIYTVVGRDDHARAVVEAEAFAGGGRQFGAVVDGALRALFDLPTEPEAVNRGWEAIEALVHLLDGVLDALESDDIPAGARGRHFPSAYYRDEFGIPLDRLRGAVRDGRLRARRQGRRNEYRYADVHALWREDCPHDPPSEWFDSEA